MRNLNVKLILLTVLLSIVGTKVSAADIAVQNGDGVTIYYNFINNGAELEVTEMPNSEKYAGDIVIPETVTYEGNVYKVTRIGKQAFHGDDLTSVVIPNSVTTIAKEAFYACYKLTSVTIGNSVTTIEEAAFNGCRVLETLTIPSSVTSIEKGAFAGCGITSLVIEDAPVSLGYNAFGTCKNLVSVDLGNNIKIIGANAFYDCDKLPSITIPNSVTEIGDWAFNWCDELMEVISLIETPFETPTYVFNDDNYNKATLYVPKGKVSLYKEVTCWKRFKNIVEMAGDYCYLTLKYAETGCMKLLVKRGASHTIAIEAEEGWKVSSVTYNDEDVTSSLDEENQFTTPAITADAVLRAVYSKDTQVESIENKNVNVKAVKGGLWIDGAKENSVCQVFTTDGKLLKTLRITNNKTFVSLNDGQVYIVKVGEKTLKAAF
jgi:hypothetical protein